ncbi:MAG: hypothetical protein HYV17_04920 [Xanthomonadales bacterium]|nr:hypothetical protein [Xanthomonadales bacterium]
MHIVIDSERDRRELSWPVEQAGEDAVASACIQLAGQRRAFPSNVAQVLRLNPPKALALASPESTAAHMAAIAKLLGVANGNP